jgi:hypothetical protein
LTGHWFFSTAATYNLYVVRASGVEAEKEGTSHNAMQDRFGQRYRDVQFFANRPAFEQALHDCRAAAREVLMGSPVIAVRQYAQGWFQLLLGPGAHSLDNSLRQTPPASSRWRARLYGAVLLAIAIAGIVGAVRFGGKAVLPAALVVYFLALSGGGGANSRFRTPVTPMLAILAVAGVTTSRRTE